MQLYSPQAPEEYCGPGEGIGKQLRSAEMRPLWNLYWLSEPEVDRLLDHSATAVPPRLDIELLQACRASLRKPLPVSLWEVAAYCSPGEMIHYVENVGARQFPPYRLRGMAWCATMRERSKVYPAPARKEGNVTYVPFGGRPTSGVTTGRFSAKIMPLALRKIRT